MSWGGHGFATGRQTRWARSAERLRTDDDRRVVAVDATQLGRQTVEEIDMIRRSQMAAVLARLNGEQQQRALRTFRDLRRAAEALDAAADAKTDTDTD